MTKWYALRGKEVCGPYDYIEVIRQLQDKQLFEYDLVWTKGLIEWTPIATLRDFCAERLLEVKAGKDAHVFEKRKNPRAMLELPAWAHDSQMVWPGRTLSLSAEGAGVSLPNPGLLPGDTFKFHFKNRIDQWAITTDAKVLSKGYRKNLEKMTESISYNVQFLNISDDLKKLINKSILQGGLS